MNHRCVKVLKMNLRCFCWNILLELHFKYYQFALQYKVGLIFTLYVD